MTTSQHTPKFKKQRKFLVVMPLLVIPFLLFAFYSMGGGEGTQKSSTAKAAGMGFNTQLPQAQFDKKDAGMNKLAFYKKADEDSVKKNESLRQDPYHSLSMDTISCRPLKSPGLAFDPRANELIKKLDQLKQSVQQPHMLVHHTLTQAYSFTEDTVRHTSGRTLTPGLTGTAAASNISKLEAILRATSVTDTPKTDPQLAQLSKMLDKVLQIQRNEPNTLPDRHNAAEASKVKTEPLNDSSSNAIPAIVQENQTLVAGATIALRLPEESIIDRIRIPRDELVYGVVSINNDRMLIHINSIRFRQSIYFTALQVYDMDGLPGIHIPDMLNRDVAKESADQGVNSMDLAAFEPGIGAQAANAGIQAAKSLISRKVRLVRVSVRAGYQVLLRNTKGPGSSGILRAIGDTTRVKTADSIQHAAADSIHAPSGDSLHAFLHEKVSNGKVKLILQGIYLRNDIMWFSFRVKNRSRIGFSPAYTRCYVEDKRRMKRTAFQEIPLHPLYETPVTTIAGDSEQTMEMGFHPFSIAKDKKLIIQMAEQDGSRQLDLAISPGILLKAK